MKTYPALTSEVLDRAIRGEVVVVLRALQGQPSMLCTRDARVDMVEAVGCFHDKVDALTEACSANEYEVFSINNFQTSDILL
jgi:hypothetical protein